VGSIASGYAEDNPLWYKDAVIYELYIKAFYDSDGNGVGDFNGLTMKLDYLKDLGVNTVWLLPFYPSPLKDDGYDIADYFNVHPQYGAFRDFKEFLREAHKREIKVVIELVLNHTSDQHPWFQRSRSTTDPTWRNLYVWSGTPERYKDARIIFKDFETSNWAWDTVARAYYWHRFYSHQPDLNYDNPEVQKRMLEVIDFWLKMGVDGLRLDAVPYLFEREGTNCENLPEVHEFLKKVRAHVDANYKNKMLLAEANQWPNDAVAYLGNDDECHMAFHFPLMPRMFMAIDLEDCFPIMDILENTPSIQKNSQWAIFLRNHDELTLEMVTDEERDYMYKVYAKDKHARINLGIRRRLAPLLGNDRRKIELMNVLLLTLPGTPVIYYGDEIGMGDDYYLGDRNGVRTPMQWSAEINAGFSKVNPQRLYLPVIIDPEYNYEAVNVENQIKNPSSLFWWMKKIIAVRKHFKAFGRGDIEFQSTENNKVLVFFRRYEGEVLLVAANLSRYSQVAQLDLSPFEGYAPYEVLGGTAFPTIGKMSYILTFHPYGYYIFSLAKETGSKAPQILTKLELRLENSLEEVFKGGNIDRLESEILPIFLKGNRWFGGKSREIERIKIREILPLEGGTSYFLKMSIVDVYYKEGLPDAYLLPMTCALGGEARSLAERHPQSVIAKVNLGGEEGVLSDGVYDEKFHKFLLRMMAKRRTIKGIRGELRGSPREKLRGIMSEGVELTSEVLSAEQSNTSITYEEKGILKLFRRAEEGMNPELEITDLLAKTSFLNFPQLLGDIRYYERGSEPVIVSILQAFIKNEGDAWKFCLNEVGRYHERVMSQRHEISNLTLPPSFLVADQISLPPQLLSLIGKPFIEMVALLGRRTGEFHKALLSGKDDPDFAPEPFNYLYQLALSHSMISYAKRILQNATRSKNIREDVRKELEIILNNQDLILNQFRSLRQIKLDSLRIRLHGDYHLGQVLYTGKDFVIIDFEGEPARSLSERRLKKSPLRDVAGMIRSFHYVAYVSLFKSYLPPEDFGLLERWANQWSNCCVTTFLNSYFSTVKDTGIIPSDKESFKTLLKAYLLEKGIYELGYELNNRPDWARIPIRGIRDLLGI